MPERGPLTGAVRLTAAQPRSSPKGRAKNQYKGCITMLTLDKIYHAAFVLKDVARKTDLIEAPKLSKDCQRLL